MKNIMKLSLIALSFAALAGCSTVSSTLGLGKNSDDANTSKAVKAPEVSADSSAPTAKISLKQNDKDQIVATIYTNYNNNPEGSIKLQWKAPEGTSCYDTSFPIAKYGEKNDKTWASVEIKQGDKFCKGDWTANVVFDQDVIATDTILVS
jgi:hypothetical protein